MDTTQILLIALIVILISSVMFIVSKINKPKEKDNGLEKMIQMIQTQISSTASVQNEKLDRTITELNNRLNDTNKTLNDQLNNSQKNISQQFAISQQSIRETSNNAAKIIKEVTEKLTKLDDTNKQVVNFAEQLQSLENILKNPKQRGVLGEYFLETVLKNVLPPGSYEMQYKFNNGEIVDAAVFVGKKIIPVDAKFSLENYNRILEAKDEAAREPLEREFKNDLKKRIDETSKYIRPEEGTMTFAFMFIPSEGIYYDLLINQVGAVKTNTHDLIEYAFKQKNVIIVSPTSFLAYLQTVLQGLNSLKIEEKALEIKDNVEKLQKHIGAFDQNFAKLGKNLGTVVGAYNDARGEYKKIDKDLFRITDNAIAITSEDTEKPSFDL
ncbi:MAG: DNA recombination protein RmuC [Candidatus Dojkabacteria bacterium]